MKLFLRVLVLALLLLGKEVQAQVTVTVVENSGSTTAITLDESGELYFTDEQMTVVESSLTGNQQVFALDAVAKVLFEGEFVGAGAPTNASQPLLYPNPTTSEVIVSGVGEAPQRVAVYAATGSLLMQGLYRDGDRMDVSSLPAGLYFVRMGEKTFKLSKL